VSIAVAIILALTVPIAAAVIPVLLLVVLGVVAYVSSRRSIIRAKHEGNWYGSVRVRLSADISGSQKRAGLPIGWMTAALVILLGATAVGIALYPTLPDLLPTHWNAAGHIDGHAVKSVWSVFGPLLIGFGVLALLFACSIGAVRAPSRIVASQTGDGRDRAMSQRRLLISLLGQLAVVMAAVLGWLSVAGWLAPGSPALVFTGTIGMLVLIAGVLVVFLIRWRTVIRASGDASAAQAPDAPDDDRHWMGGVFYVNRDDPAIFVPRRFGIGWTMNLGNAGGIALAVLLILLVAGAIVTATVVPGMTNRS
jgi:uncharacterized membrane protein